MAPEQSNQRKGFTLVPPGQHPGVTPHIPDAVPPSADGIVVSTDAADSLIRRAINVPDVPPNQASPAKAEPLPEPEPIIYDDEDDEPHFDELQATVSSSASEDDEPLPPAIDPILDLAGHDQRASQFSALAQQATDEIQRAADANRSTVLAQFISQVAADPSHAVNSEMRRVFDEFLISNLMSTATAETSIKDLGFAISEQGAKVVLDEKSTRDQFQKLLWIRSYRELLTTLNLDDHAPTLMALEIERTFGRTQTAEDLRSMKERDDERSAFTQLIDAVGALRHEIRQLNKTESTRSSVFIKAPAQRHVEPTQPTQPNQPAEQPQ